MRERNLVATADRKTKPHGSGRGSQDVSCAVELYPSEVLVALVDGPTVCLEPAVGVALDRETYRVRTQGVPRLAHLHPTRKV
jgi:hypothetical protein